MDDAGLTPVLQVRRARPDEIGRCADLYVKVLRDTFTWLPPDRHRQEDFFRAASEDIARTCRPHPTRSEALRQAAMGVEGWTMQA